MAKSKNQKEAATPTKEKLPTKQSALPQYEYLAAMQVTLTAPGRYLDNPKVRGMLADGAHDLYRRLGPKDAVDSILAMLAVSVTSASLDCLSQAARVSPEYLQHRDLNLRYGLKGAATAAELIKVLESRRREKPKKITVGNVNVESGGQAIVGNVEAPTPRASPPSKNSTAE